MSGTTRRRVGTVDFLKFLFSIMIVLCHAAYFYKDAPAPLAGAGFIAVEFFFVVSGYLLAARAAKFRGGSLWDANLDMLRGKVMRMFPYLLCAAVVSHLFYAWGSFSAAEVWHRGLFTLTDLFGLQMEGYSGFIASGVSWYLSALFAVSFVMYPILCAHRRAFSRFFAPVSALLIYGGIARTVGGLSYPDAWWGLVYQGLLRGWAGMSLGCMAYELRLWLDESEGQDWLWGLLELAGFLIILLYGLFYTASDLHDYFTLPLLVVAVAVAFSRRSLLGRLFGGERISGVCSRLGVFSMSIYLNHFTLTRNLGRILPTWGPRRLMALYLPLTLALALINYFAGKGLSRVLNSMKRVVLAAMVFLVIAQGFYWGNALFMSRARASLAGTGTVEDPVRVQSAQDLKTFRDLVNAGEDFAGQTVLQTDDIDLSGENWLPIGIFGTDRVFRGVYDGGNHVIDGLFIESNTTRDSGNVGLFGMLQGTVRNLGIAGGDISGDYAGAVASQATAGAQVINCYNLATVRATGRAGGIADNFNGATLTLCANGGDLFAPVTGEIIAYGADCVTGSWPEPGEAAREYVSVPMEGETLAQRLNAGIAALREAGLIGPEITPWP